MSSSVTINISLGSSSPVKQNILKKKCINVEQKVENSNQLIVSECILVSNLDTSLNKADVEEIFKRIGPVKNMILIHDSTGTFQGMAIVYFSKFKDAEKALEYDEAEVDGRPMRIQYVNSSTLKWCLPKQQSTYKKPKNNSKRTKTKRLTHDDLDRELEEYHRNAKTNDALEYGQPPSSRL